MKLQLGILSAGVALATLGTSAAQAALVVVPPDLAVGDQYRLVFVTEGKRDATSTNIDDYNTFVTNQVTGSALANALSAAGLTTTWKAIGSTSATSAKVNTGTDGSQPDVPIYLIDGNRVANNNNDLWDGSIQTAIYRTPLDTVSTSLVWTGTTFVGLTTSYGLGGCFGGCGFDGFVARGSSNVSFQIGGSWIFGFVNFYLDHLPLYGISSVLTVPGGSPQQVPEPSSLLGYITLGGLMLGGAVRKARK